MNVGQFCSHRIVKVSESATLAEVAQLMNEQSVGAVIVTSSAATGGKVTGIITDRDIVSAQLDRTAGLSSLSARDAMTRRVLTVTEDLSVDSVLSHMRAKGVRRAPVVNSEGVPIGLVSIDDLLAQIAVRIVGIAGIVAQQARHKDHRQ